MDLGVPILLMDATWNYTQPEDIGHWNGMERFVYHFAGSPSRGMVLPTLDWQARPLSAWRGRARRLVRNVYHRMRSAGANPRSVAARAERQPLHRLALKLAQEAICRQADHPITRLDQLRVLPVRSGPARQEQFMTPEFLFWCNRLKEAPRWHRKVWEYVMICQALWERGMLRAGRRGCGFRIGQEFLPELLPDAEAASAPAGAQHAAFPQRLADHHVFPELPVPPRQLLQPVAPEQELGRHELRLRGRSGPDGQNAQLIEASDGLIGLPADRLLGEFQREAMQRLPLGRATAGRLIRSGLAHLAINFAREPARPRPPHRGGRACQSSDGRIVSAVGRAGQVVHELLHAVPVPDVLRLRVVPGFVHQQDRNAEVHGRVVQRRLVLPPDQPERFAELPDQPPRTIEHPGMRCARQHQDSGVEI